MANPAHVELLLRDVNEWNFWRRINEGVVPDLVEANLHGGDFRRANLREANIGNANLIGADLAEANLRRANLRSTQLVGADIVGAHLGGADLTRADLARCNLIKADLNRTDLSRAIFRDANLDGSPGIFHLASGQSRSSLTDMPILPWLPVVWRLVRAEVLDALPHGPT